MKSHNQLMAESLFSYCRSTQPRDFFCWNAFLLICSLFWAKGSKKVAPPHSQQYLTIPSFNPLYPRRVKIYLKECSKVTYSVHLLHTISAAQISTAVTMLLQAFLLSCAMAFEVMSKVFSFQYECNPSTPENKREYK